MNIYAISFTGTAQTHDKRASRLRALRVMSVRDWCRTVQQRTVHNPLCAWSGSTLRARHGRLADEEALSKSEDARSRGSRLVRRLHLHHAPEADVSDFTNHARHAWVALVIGLPNDGPRSLLLVHLVRVRVRVRVRVSQPYQPKTLSPTLQA